jgi:hypothetical protein
LALLARQGWRILQNPQTLSARILKAIYFPQTDFLSTELGAHPSRVWRSIMEGRVVLATGLIRCIGTGEETDAWNDNWIPRDGQMRPIFCKSQNPPQRVADFIDHFFFDRKSKAILRHTVGQIAHYNYRDIRW